MANFSAADVKKLRDATGAGMMECKKALEDADGDADKALEVLRIKGEAKAAKRGAERTASNGLVAASEGAMIELASETDFVAKNEQFQSLAGDIVAQFAASSATDLESLLQEKLKDGRTVAENVEGLNAVIGEKLELRRAVKLGTGPGQSVATYLHRKAKDLPPQVGVLVQFSGASPEAARAAAMQVAAMRPQFLTREQVPAEAVETERRVAEAKAREDGKPESALPKIIEGTVNGYFKTNVLLEQTSVQDNKKSVQAMLDEAGVTVTRFAHFEVGQA
ncbi:MAG: elongation factor Ts [Pseudonocardiales bacterium]|nr:MAG: elongation factor Ts [Pseudonocardiales bacterium]